MIERFRIYNPLSKASLCFTRDDWGSSHSVLSPVCRWTSLVCCWLARNQHAYLMGTRAPSTGSKKANKSTPGLLNGSISTQSFHVCDIKYSGSGGLNPQIGVQQTHSVHEEEAGTTAQGRVQRTYHHVRECGNHRELATDAPSTCSSSRPITGTNSCDERKPLPSNKCDQYTRYQPESRPRLPDGNGLVVAPLSTLTQYSTNDTTVYWGILCMPRTVTPFKVEI